MAQNLGLVARKSGLDSVEYGRNLDSVRVAFGHSSWVEPVKFMADRASYKHFRVTYWENRARLRRLRATISQAKQRRISENAL